MGPGPDCSAGGCLNDVVLGKFEGHVSEPRYEPCFEDVHIDAGTNGTQKLLYYLCHKRTVKPRSRLQIKFIWEDSLGSTRKYDVSKEFVNA